jgi:hypothetical protein
MRSAQRITGLLLLAVPLACADLLAPASADDVTTPEHEFTSAFFAFDYAGAYEGSVAITLDYRDLEIVQPETPGHMATHAWVEARFVPSSSSPYCSWPAPCPADRWWIIIEAYYPAPGQAVPRFIELLIPSRADGTFGGTYDFACGPPDVPYMPECVFTGSIRDEHCAGTNGMPLWCLYADRAGQVMFGVDSRLLPGVGWTGILDARGVTAARITIDEPIPLSPYPAPAQRLRGSFSAALQETEGGADTQRDSRFAEPVQITHGRFDLEVR